MCISDDARSCVNDDCFDLPAISNRKFQSGKKSDFGDFASSAAKNLLSVPRTFSSHGDRAFYSCAPKLWNSLPADLHFCSSLDIFKKTLKTHLFKIAYDST